MRNRFENLNKAKSLSTPWLLVHGLEDELVPFVHAETLARTDAGPRRLVALDCGHEDAVIRQEDRLEAAVEEFVIQVVASDNGHSSSSVHEGAASD